MTGRGKTEDSPPAASPLAGEDCARMGVAIAPELPSRMASHST